MALGNRWSGLWLALFALSACGEAGFELYPEAADEQEEDLCAKVTCKAPDACHAAGVCDPESGECTYEALSDGSACDDGNACTYSDRCEAGKCEGGGAVECRAVDACHLAGTCDPQAGCSSPVRDDGSPCGDDNACTSNDHCEAGACVGTSKTCPPAEACFEEGMCNAATGECSYAPQAAGSVCDPGDVKKCAEGQCDGKGACVQTAVTCEALDSCHEAGLCDPDTGTCSNPVKDDGTVCDDGEVCTSGDICRDGLCAGAQPTACPALDACHLAGTCEAGMGCVYPTAPNGTKCEDGDLCTLNDKCQLGECGSGARKVCTASGPCTLAGSCDSDTGTCSQIPLASGTSCEDGDLCTRNTTCSDGLCAGGAPVTCASDDPCKLPIACDPVLGCLTENAPDGTACEEGDLCTQNDTCVAGTCTAGAAKTCAALNACQLAGVCDPDSGLCSVRWVANGGSCDDNDSCTSGDACNDGQCAGEAIVCDDPCLANAACDPNQGRCVGTPVADGTACEGESLCATSSSCQAGECTTKTSKACSALDGCHQAGVCDEVSGECSQPTAYTGAACANGFCFADVTVQAGLRWPEEKALPLRATGGFIDANVDGLLDVLFVSEAHGLLLFVNEGNGSFVSAPIPGVASPTGVSAADYDNDSDVDLFVTSTASTALLRNDGAGVFSNVASTAGVVASGNSTASTFADFDADGWLDLYVGNQPIPGDSSSAANRLYRNLGNGTFQNVTSGAQVGGNGKTMAVVASDVDGDGYPELLVCNDSASGFDGNVVYDNSGSATAGMTGRFTQLGSAVAMDCLGGGVGDFDRDGDSDYFWAAIGDNVLWSNAAGVFTNVANAQGVKLAKDACSAQTTASWEAGFHDFDADGWLDLYVSNGGEVPGVAGVTPYSPNALLRNNGGTSFTDVGLSAGAADARRGRGVAFGDYDGDGDVDILQLNAKGSPLLLKNQTVNSNGWAALTLEGTESNRDGIGAQVLWSATGFSRLDERRASAGTSGPSDARLFTGLGSAQEAHAEIDWPSGTAQHLFYLARNTTSAAVEPSLTIVSGSLGAASVKQGTSVSVSLSMSATASDGTYSVRLFSGHTPQATTLATPVLTADKATLSVTIGAAATTGASTLVVRVTDASGGRDELMLPLTVTVP